MPTAARHARALVLIVATLIVAGGDSIALPLAHHFADHHHKIAFSYDGGNWQWVAVDDHQGGQAAVNLSPNGHDHDMRDTEAALRLGNTSGLSLALILAASNRDECDAGPAALRHTAPHLAPDIGKPDLALLATMRV